MNKKLSVMSKVQAEEVSNDIWLNSLERAVIEGDINKTKKYLKKNLSFRLLPIIDHSLKLFSKWKIYNHIYHLESFKQFIALHQVLLKQPHLIFICAKLAIAKGEVASLHYLLQFDFDINTIDELGNTLLHLAVKQNQFELTDLIIAYGASTHIKNEHGLMPLDLAIMNKHEAIALLLLEHYTDSHQETIILCIYSGWLNILLELLKLDSTLIDCAIKHAIVANNAQALFLIVNCFSIRVPLNDIRNKLQPYIQPQCYHILQSGYSLNG